MKFISNKCKSYIRLFTILYLISFALTENLESKLRRIRKNVKESRFGDDTKGIKKIKASKQIVNTCMAAISSAMPPAFCWKAGGDFGVIPTGCPKGYFRFLAMCYKNCGEGYEFVLGICYKKCESGYVNHGLTCFKNLLSWYFKSSFIPDALTNFSAKVPCPGNMYKSGALCYRDCETIGMYNCGIGACVSEKATCINEIMNMVGKTFEGIATLIITVLTVGGSTAIKSATTSLETGIRALGKQAINAAKNALKKLFNEKLRKFIIQKAKNQLKVYIKENLKDSIKDFFIQKLTDAAKETAIHLICKEVWETAITKSFTAPDIEDLKSLGLKALESFDVFGVKGMVDDCGSNKNGLNCAKSVVEGLSGVDPTGLLTISAAFMHPSCDIPEIRPDGRDPMETKELNVDEIKKLEQENRNKVDTHTKLINNNQDINKNDIEATKLLAEIHPYKVWMYPEDDFKGEKYELNSKIASNATRYYFRKTQSFVCGSKQNGIFFENEHYQGNYIPFTSNLAIRDLSEYSFGDINLKDNVKSIWLGDEPFVSFYFKDKTVINIFLRPDKLVNIDEDELLQKKKFTKENGGLFFTISVFFKQQTVTITWGNGTKKDIKSQTTININDMPSNPKSFFTHKIIL